MPLAMPPPPPQQTKGTRTEIEDNPQKGPNNGQKTGAKNGPKHGPHNGPKNGPKTAISVHANDLNPASYKYLVVNAKNNKCGAALSTYNMDGR